MAFDTKYRPTEFGQVIGQGSTVQILKEIIRAGAGFHQSYLFCGPFGSGKTTLGRILARTLLCDAPVDGVACGQCASCLAILDTGGSVDFVEVDAATNSGKDNIRNIIEQIQYSSFSGKRRIYLFDEAHQLSRDALDALLKPMEDSHAGSEDKRLVCIFCTTEPEKMRSTVVSRCAPAFVIRHASTEDIVSRLSYVCEQEGLNYDKGALALIAEHSEAHIRDALKTLEGVSLMGDVTPDSVTKYLHLDTSVALLSLVAAMAEGDAALSNQIAQDLLHIHSPAVLYERVAESAITLYAHGLGAGRIPSWWNVELAAQVSGLGPILCGVADRFASRPGRVNASTFMCDVALSTHGTFQAIPQPSPNQIRPTASPSRGKTVGRIYHPVSFQSSPAIVGGAYLDPRGVNKAKVDDGNRNQAHTKQPRPPGRLSANAFSDHVVQRLLELNDGREGQKDVGDT